jgi:thiosulfate/3-mercaptopyruvate sulfurtransferase
LLAERPGSTDAFEKLMSSRGIRPSDHVVLYGDQGNQYASAVLWLMRHHGHRSLRLMDGGRSAWLAQGLPMSEEETVRPTTHYRAGPPHLSVRATRDDLPRSEKAPSGAEVVVDCRTEQEFAGLASGPTSQFGDLCAERGHVPGAVHLPASDLLDPDCALLPADDLRHLLDRHGLRPDQPVIAYCHTSDRSCLVWFALHEVLGWPSVRVYDGGWLEYGHLMGAPVARPSQSRLDDEPGD